MQTAAPATREKSQARPTSAEKAEEDYTQYEAYADEDQAILPELNVSVDAKQNRIVYAPAIDFYFAKDLIKPSSLSALKELADELAKHPDSPLIVRGTARGPGWLARVLPLAKSLSRARANSVLRHLIVTEKIKQINVTALGEGDEFPDLGKRPAGQPVLEVVVK